MVTENEKLKEEIAFLRQEIDQIKERIKFDQKVVDANVVEIYQKMKRKSNEIWTVISVICSCALWVLFGLLIHNGNSDAEIICCLIFLSISMVFMAVNVFALAIYAFKDIVDFIKKRNEIKMNQKK